MKRKFIVTLEIPRGVTVSEMKNYIEDAVACWKGGGDPEGALFDLDGDSVKVVAVPVKKKPAPA